MCEYSSVGFHPLPIIAVRAGIGTRQFLSWETWKVFLRRALQISGQLGNLFCRFCAGKKGAGKRRLVEGGDGERAYDV